MFDLFGNPITAQTQCKVSVQNGALMVMTPYNAQFVALIKSLPASVRRFDPNTRSWLVDTQYAGQVRDWIMQCYGEDIGMITVSAKPSPEMRICDVWYLGRTKPSGDEWIASGINGRKEWEFVFPERVLREWFEGDAQYTNVTTLYGVLGIQRTATDDEIKSGYRRMARQWHPDVCKEPNAQEMFLHIKEAYELLSNPDKRAKYDAGLALEASLKKDEILHATQSGYRAPLRCGYILAEGYESVGRFVIEKIIQWEDITSEKGVLVAAWPAGATEPVWVWR